MTIAQLRSPRGRWRACADSLPIACQEFLALEAAASGVQVWEPQRVPDLLQTRDYARALADADPRFADDKAREEATGMLLGRQQTILEERRTEVTMIIAETALRQPVGGLGVMRAQLAALAKLADDSGHVTIYLLPSSRGAQPPRPAR